MRIIVALGLVVAGLLVSTPLAPVSADQADRAATTELRPLHVTRGKDPAIRNTRGARVLLNGVNVIGLGEYYQANPDLVPNEPIGSDDFEQIAALGFNSVRLIVNWSALEPTRGAYDSDYIDQVRAAVDDAAAQGLYTIIDMHQDAWGIAVDTPDGVTCPEKTRPAVGWDGAPAWATITDGLSTCRSAERELTPAVQRAWQHFYDNTDGIQTALVKAWGRLAREFAGNPAVAGFDLLNEPGFGSAIGAETKPLGKFYGRTIKAIRSAETAAGGLRHIVFFEPSVGWSALGTWAVPSDFTTDRNIAFSPHIYAETFSSMTIAKGFAAAAKAAAAQRVPVWVGEWGYFSGNPADDAGKLDRFGAAQDDYGYGGAWWTWKQSCGNPHMIAEPGGQPGPISQSLIRYTCPDEVEADAPDPAYGEVLSRPLPRTVPGTTRRLDSDGRRGTFVLAGRREKVADRCSLRVFVPSVWADQRIRSTGINRLATRTNHGNLIVRGCVTKKFRLRLG